jgi:hypothetical protein
VGQNSSVGIATGYGLDGPGIEFRSLLVPRSRKSRAIPLPPFCAFGSVTGVPLPFLSLPWLLYQLRCLETRGCKIKWTVSKSHEFRPAWLINNNKIHRKILIFIDSPSYYRPVYHNILWNTALFSADIRFFTALTVFKPVCSLSSLMRLDDCWGYSVWDGVYY